MTADPDVTRWQRVMLETSIEEAGMANRIVAAVDSSPASRAALTWAFGKAATTGDDLLAVHVLEPTQESRPAESRDNGIADAAALTQMWVLRALPDISDAESPVRVIISAQGGALAHSLARASRDALMVVVGEPQSADHADLPEALAAECTCAVVAVSENYDVRHVSGAGEGTEHSDRTAS
jgi:nucleotide-binding universal stress UspA family protein